VQAVAGDTLKWTRTFSGYLPSDGWALSYAIKSASASLDVAGITITDDGKTFTVTIPATATAKWRAGDYRVVAMVTKAVERYTVATTALNVKPDPGGSAAADLRSQAEKDLDAINGVLSGRVTNDLQSYTIGGRVVTKIPIKELLALKSYCMATVRKERIEAGETVPTRRVGVTF
jgi:hypothetical protein